MTNNNYKLDNIINHGYEAVIYKIKIKGKYYTLRRQKIEESTYKILKNFKKLNKFKNDDLLDLIIPVNQVNDDNVILNIYFNTFINTIDTNHFTILYKYNIGESNFIMPITDIEKNNEKLLKNVNRFNSLKYCIDTITDLKDGVLSDIMTNLNKKQVYSLIIQISYALHLMHINNYIHGDPYSKNICYKKTKLKKIKILNLDIPTYGYIFSLIDYGIIVNYKFTQRSIDKFIFNYTPSKDFMFFLMYGIFNIWLNDNKQLYYLIIKIQNNPHDKSIIKDENFHIFDTTLLNYAETKKFILLMNDSPKLIKFFYNLLSLK